MVIFLILAFLIGLGFLFWASADVGSGVYLKTICHGDRSLKHVSLTFDDGPDENTLKILEVLKKYQIKACFFLIGSKVKEHSEIVKRIYEDGHLIGNHTFKHSPSYTLWSSKKIRQDIEKANSEIFDIIGVVPKLFRPPYGVTNPLIKNGLDPKFTCIGWSMRSYDTIKQIKTKIIVERIVNNIKNGDIVLLHDRRYDTPEVFEELIFQIQKKGLKIVPLDNLLKIDVYEK